MRGMAKVKFNIREDFNRFCDEARDHDIQVRGVNERRMTVTVSSPTEQDVDVIERVYNGRVSEDPQFDLDGPF